MIGGTSQRGRGPYHVAHEPESRIVPPLDRLGLHSTEAHAVRTRVYVTNSVKHFKFVQVARGRRLHKKPTSAEIKACHPWLQEEIRLVKPRVIADLEQVAAYLRRNGKTA